MKQHFVYVTVFIAISCNSQLSWAETDKPSKDPTWPQLDDGLWSLVQSTIWPLLAVVLLLLFRRQIGELISSLVKRVESGGALKAFGVELDSIRIPVDNTLPTGGAVTVTKPSDEWRDSRENVYDENQRVFLAHRLFPSELEGQLYDVLIYAVPHKSRDGTLRDVERIDYYFGGAWGNRVFTVKDGDKRFGILISAYGSGFLCFAKIHFTDNTSVKCWRYIDFEMGALGVG